jgi:septal ring factor EnvC (AmiA/AmiB activator)
MPLTSRGWRLRGLFLITAALALAACANEVPPPTTEVTLADSTIRDAETAGAVQYSPVELNTAREKLEAARRNMQDDNNEQARRLAEEAEVDARLAELRARTKTTRDAVAAIQSSIDTLRRELNTRPTS